MDETWGKRVLRLRAAAGLTQDELAAKSGVPASHISRIENDKQVSGQISTARKLARGLNVNLIELMGKQDGPTLGSTSYDAALRTLQSVLPPRVKVYETLEAAELGGKETMCVVTNRRTPDDEIYLFGIKCQDKSLPSLLDEHSTAIIDKRAQAPGYGNVVVFAAGGVTMFGVFRALGDRHWAENAVAPYSYDLDQITHYKASDIVRDVRGYEG